MSPGPKPKRKFIIRTRDQRRHLVKIASAGSAAVGLTWSPDAADAQQFNYEDLPVALLVGDPLVRPMRRPDNPRRPMHVTLTPPPPAEPVYLFLHRDAYAPSNIVAILHPQEPIPYRQVWLELAYAPDPDLDTED